jgi:hypothetical protein
MPKATKKREPPADKDKSQQDRAPYQKSADRNPVKSAEETRNVPTKHGAIK